MEPSFFLSPPSTAPAANFLGLALHLLAHLLRLLAHVPGSVREPPLRMLRHLLRRRAGRLPYVVHHPRERGQRHQPERPRREEARHGEPDDQRGWHEHGAEDDEQWGGQAEPMMVATKMIPARPRRMPPAGSIVMTVRTLPADGP